MALTQRRDQRQGGEFVVEKLDDKEELRDFLVEDKLANAYILGNLTPDFFPFCDRWGARDGNGNLGTVLFVYDGLSLPVVTMAGANPLFQEFMATVQPWLPDRFQFQALDTHIDTLKSLFDIDDARKRYRMGLHRTDYSPKGVLENSSTDIKRLEHRDTSAIMELYKHYPDNFFQPSQLDTGYYFGIPGNDGSLLSIAGVHVVNEKDDIAVVGNMLTHPSARGEGLGTMVCEKLLNELFQEFSLVGLNVSVDNDPALQMYRNVGFEINNTFWKGRYEVSTGD